MSPEKVSHTWFIEPLSSFTNEVLAKNQEFLSDEYIVNGILCEDGKRHKLWRCVDYTFVSAFLKSRSMGCVFSIWHQGGKGQIRQWEFHAKKRKRILTVKRGDQTVVLN